MKNMRIEQSVEITETGVSTSTRIVNNKDKWTPAQRGMLLLLVSQHKSWETIGTELKRTPSSCRSMYTYVSLKDKINTLETKNDRLNTTNVLRDAIIATKDETISALEETVEILESIVAIHRGE